MDGIALSGGYEPNELLLFIEEIVRLRRLA